MATVGSQDTGANVWSDDNCGFTFDLIHLRQDRYCPICHNLSLHDYGPAERPSDLLSGALDYHTQAFSRTSDEHLVFAIQGKHRLLDIEVLILEDNPCRFCQMIGYCIRVGILLIKPSSVPYTDWTAVIRLRKSLNVFISLHWVGTARGVEFDLGVLDGEYFVPDLGEPTHEPLPSCERQSLLFACERVWECQNHHTGCIRPSAKLWPTRLLCLDPPHPAIVSTSSLDSGTKYTALSHCWGNIQPMKTTRSNLSQHQQGIAFRSMPVLFRDAIMVTRQLGIKYIWIDSLCIIQDSIEDWATEAQAMGHVYANAYCTIAAERCKDSTEPFLGIDVRNSREHFQFRMYSNGSAGLPGGPVQVRARIIWTLRDSSDTNPLTTRAWAYQEKVLSTRLLSFNKSEVTFACSFGEVSETTRSWRKTRDLEKGLVSPDHHNYWKQVVRAYTSRDLTFVADKLPAISGVAAWLAEQLGSVYVRYLAGLWLHSIASDLVWFTRMTRGRIGQSYAPPFESSRIPTWSWASIDASIGWSPSMRLHYDTFVTFCEVTEYFAAPTTLNDHGAVDEYSFLMIRGRLIDAYIRPRRTAGTSVLLYELTSPLISFAVEIWEDCTIVGEYDYHGSVIPARARSKESAGKIWTTKWPLPVRCLLIGHTVTTMDVLVIGPSLFETGTFERLGLWEVESHNSELWTDILKVFEEAEPCEITLM